MNFMFRYFKKLIDSSESPSSTRFTLVLVSVISCMLLICVGFVLIFEVLKEHTIKTDLTGLATFVGSITSLIVAVGGIKVFNSKNANKLNNDKENTDN